MISVRRFFDRVFMPIARRLDGVDPNHLTYASMICGLLAGLAFALADASRWSYAAAGVLVALSGTADALDGLVARHFGRESARGDFLDHFGDRVIEVAILAGITLSPGANRDLGTVVIIVTLLHSYAGAQMEATFGNRGHEGAGKTEQFVALVVFAGVLALAPDFRFTVGPVGISLATLFLGILGGLTGIALVHRLARAGQMARRDDQRREDRTPR